MRQTIGLFFFFGLVAFLCDRSWVQLGVLTYYTGPFKQPWWVFLQLGAVGVIAVCFARYVTYYLVRRDTPVPADLTARFAISAAWFVAAYISCGLLDATRARRLAAALFVIWALRFIVQRPQKGERLAILIICFGLAVAGPAAEMLLSYYGVMHYERPFYFRYGVPVWLPTLFLQAGYLARDIARAWFGGR
jgi:hypothetical protein